MNKEQGKRNKHRSEAGKGGGIKEKSVSIRLLLYKSPPPPSLSLQDETSILAAILALTKSLHPSPTLTQTLSNSKLNTPRSNMRELFHNEKRKTFNAQETLPKTTTSSENNNIFRKQQHLPKTTTSSENNNIFRKQQHLPKIGGPICNNDSNTKT